MCRVFNVETIDPIHHHVSDVFDHVHSVCQMLERRIAVSTLGMDTHKELEGMLHCYLEGHIYVLCCIGADRSGNPEVGAAVHRYCSYRHYLEGHIYVLCCIGADSCNPEVRAAVHRHCSYHQNMMDMMADNFDKWNGLGRALRLEMGSFHSSNHFV